MKHYDILRYLNYCSFLPLFSDDTEDIEHHLIGNWKVIDRLTLMIPWPNYAPFNNDLNEFPTVLFGRNGESLIHYDWPGDETYKWKIINHGPIKALSWQFGTHINTYILDHNYIVYYNGDIILTRCYILVSIDAIQKYPTMKDLMGLFSILQTSGGFYLEHERNELLSKLGSKSKVNKYIEEHQDKLIYRLMNPYPLFWDKIKSLF